MREERDHRAGLQDLVKGVDLVGGPAWNLRLLRRGAEFLNPEAGRSELVWLAGIYSAVYSVHSSLVIWDAWDYLEVVGRPVAFREWLTKAWPGITVRKERLRTHGDVPRAQRGLTAAAEWARGSEALEEGDDYERLWAQVQAVPGIGRYFGIKTCGALRELGVTRAKQLDIRANGARQGRKTLAALWGVEPDNRRENDGWYESAAQDVKLDLEEEGLPLSYLELESLLCEYQQMLSGSLYPGKSTDTDLDAHERSARHFGRLHPAALAGLSARRELLPETAPESGRRPRLQPVYRDHGYVWMDAVYDDERTEDPGRPALRLPPQTDWEPRTLPELAVVA